MPGRAAARRAREQGGRAAARCSSRPGAPAALLLGLLAAGRAARAADGCDRARARRRRVRARRRGVSIAVVRQISLHAAFQAAARPRAVSLPPLLAALGGAICGRPRESGRSRAPLLLAGLVAAVGSGRARVRAPPFARSRRSSRRSRRTRCVPSRRRSSARSRSRSSSSLAVLRAGSGARGRSRWRCSAARRCCTCSTGSTSAPSATTLVALVLVAQRHDFDAPGDPAARRGPRVRAVLLAAGIFVYGALALWVNRLAIDQPVSLGLSSRETGAALLGARFRGSTHLGRVRRLVPALGVPGRARRCDAGCCSGWLAPWRYRLRQEARERRARARPRRCLGRRHARAVRAPRRQVVLLLERRARVSRLPGRGRRRDRLRRPDRAARRRTACCSRSSSPSRDARDWRFAILGASERWLELYRALGLHALYHGDEAVVETASFSLEGRPIRKVRQSVHRLERAGYRAEVLRPRAIDRDLRGELEAIARAWRGTEPERGFVMALDALFRLDDEDALFVVGMRLRTAAPAGFLHFAVCRAPAARSRSRRCRGCARRRTGSTSGSSARRSTGRATHGHRACLAQLRAVRGAARARGRAVAAAAAGARRAAAAEGPLPARQPAALQPQVLPGVGARASSCTSAARDLPRVGIAALAAEAYLPFTGRRAMTATLLAASASRWPRPRSERGLLRPARRRPPRCRRSALRRPARLAAAALRQPALARRLPRRDRRLGALRRRARARAALARPGGVGGRDRRARPARRAAGGALAASDVAASSSSIAGLVLLARLARTAARQRLERLRARRRELGRRLASAVAAVAGARAARPGSAPPPASSTRPATSRRRRRSRGGTSARVRAGRCSPATGSPSSRLQLGFQRGGALATAGRRDAARRTRCRSSAGHARLRRGAARRLAGARACSPSPRRRRGGRCWPREDRRAELPQLAL